MDPPWHDANGGPPTGGPNGPLNNNPLDNNGPWDGPWALALALLARLGIGDLDLSSRSYRVLRHFFYSCALTHLMLFGIFALCYAVESDSRCGSVLGAWAAGVVAFLLHWGAYKAVGRTVLCVCQRMYASGCLPSGPSLWYTGLCQGLASLLVAGLLYLALWLVMRCSLHLSKTFVLVCTTLCLLLCARFCARGACRLRELERRALQAERRLMRERIAGNVLTFADILEVRRGTTAEECPVVLQQQPVVRFDPDTFAEHGECCICSGPFDDHTEIRQAHCGHCFHSDCLSDWLARSPTCPLCREDLGQQVRQTEALRLEAQLAQLVGASHLPM